LAQLDVLNKDFIDTGLSFHLAHIDMVNETNWYENAGPGTPQQDYMKTLFHRGGAAALNIYTVGFINVEPAGLRGYATFPSDYAGNPTDDGVVLDFSTFPAGTSTNFNLGCTATHQVGHWLGLYDTFMGGCSTPGDFVDDTPPEAIASSGCPIGRDTCPNDPGLDRESTFTSSSRNSVTHNSSFPAVQNYMDLSNNSCLNNFTPGQINRLRDQIVAFRGIPRA
jgi:hypothetical protein